MYIKFKLKKKLSILTEQVRDYYETRMAVCVITKDKTKHKQQR